MGIVRMGIPEDLTIFLKKAFNSDIFIEGGTYYGGTALWAAENFNEVHTIELSKEIFDHTSVKYAGLKNVHFYYGDTRAVLEKILDGSNKKKSIIWLDAHWSGGNTYGENDECPLIKELEIILKSDHPACILIDDARLFLAPPPQPHDHKQFPGVLDIAALFEPELTYISIYEDVIIIVPNNLKVALQKYLQVKTTRDWENFGNESKVKASLFRRYANKIMDKLKL